MSSSHTPLRSRISLRFGNVLPHPQPSFCSLCSLVPISWEPTPVTTSCILPPASLHQSWPRLPQPQLHLSDTWCELPLQCLPQYSESVLIFVHPEETVTSVRSGIMPYLLCCHHCHDCDLHFFQDPMRETLCQTGVPEALTSRALLTG